MCKGKLAGGMNISRYALPSFERMGGVSGERRPAGREEIRASSRTPADIEREAFAHALAAAEKAGAERVANEATPLLSGLRSAVDAMSALRERFTAEAEPQVVELSVAIARRIVIEELSLDPGRIVRIAKEAIRRIHRAGPITVRVHPDLYDLIAGLEGEFLESRAGILFDVDPSVPRDAPIVSGPMEEVLTDVDEQIRVIFEEIRSERASR